MIISCIDILTFYIIAFGYKIVPRFWSFVKVFIYDEDNSRIHIRNKLFKSKLNVNNVLVTSPE